MKKPNIKDIQEENQALKELAKHNVTMVHNYMDKNFRQSWEIIELKEKLSTFKIDIAFLVVAVLFISFIAIFK